MTQSNDMHRVAPDDCTAVTHSEIVVSVENHDPRRGESTVTTDAPSPALIEAADIAEIFAQSQAALDLACAEGMYGSIEQCLEQAWPRVRQRWTLIETGLTAVAADTLSLEALRYKVALGDARQRFEGEPEEREALTAMYASLVTHMAWPKGFTRYELLEAFLLE